MAGMFDDLVPKKKGGMFDDLVDAGPKYDEKSFMQQVFDLIDPKTGKSIFYGNTPDPGPTEDLRRIARDSATRGFADKALGPEAQAKTAASRERTSDWLETPTDIAMSVATSPYSVGGKLAAAGYGGVEGALDAYGHQDSWVPNPWKIGRGAIVGSGAGAASAKIGEMLPKAGSMVTGLLERMGLKNAKKVPFNSSADLAKEASRREGMGYPKFAEDYKARADRAKMAEDAQGTDRGVFDKMFKGMDLPPIEREAVDKIASKRSLTSKAGEVLDKVNPINHGITAGLPALFDIGSMAKGSFPWGTAAALGAKGATNAMQKVKASPVTQKEVDRLLATMLDPSGKGYRVDSVGADAARDILAKMGIGAGKSYQ